MTMLMSFLLCGFILGMAVVASNPAPYFGALGLVVVAGMGSGVLTGYGGAFLALVLFLIYLGGMLVVFAYTSALAAEPYPEGLGNASVMINMLGFVCVVSVLASFLCNKWDENSWAPADDSEDTGTFRGDIGGIALIYSLGGWLLFICVMVLVLALIIVLELTRGLSRGTVRAV